MRLVPLFQGNYTEGLDSSVRNVMMTNLMKLLPAIEGYDVESVGPHGSTRAERWLHSPTGYLSDSPKYVNLWELDPHILGLRLTIL